MATAVVPKTKLAGGSFLLQEHPIDDLFTPEDLSEEHQQIAQTTQAQGFLRYPRVAPQSLRNRDRQCGHPGAIRRLGDG